MHTSGVILIEATGMFCTRAGYQTKCTPKHRLLTNFECKWSSVLAGKPAYTWLPRADFGTEKSTKNKDCPRGPLLRMADSSLNCIIKPWAVLLLPHFSNFTQCVLQFYNRCTAEHGAALIPNESCRKVMKLELNSGTFPTSSSTDSFSTAQKSTGFTCTCKECNGKNLTHHTASVWI